MSRRCVSYWFTDQWNVDVAPDDRELAMNTGSFAPILHALLGELVHGSPDPGARTCVLNRGDAGLLRSLDRLSAAAASARSGGGALDRRACGPSPLRALAAQSVGSGEAPPWPDMDWTASWRKNLVSEDEVAEASRGPPSRGHRVGGGASHPREVSEVQAGWMTGSVAHLAYHLGAIRQIDRAARPERRGRGANRGGAGRILGSIRPRKPRWRDGRQPPRLNLQGFDAQVPSLPADA